jgi:hypothetical protein
VATKKRSHGSRPAPAVGPSANDPYEIAYFKRHKADDPDETVPGQDFLNGLPATVAARFRAVVIAVAQAPPHKFVGGGKWEAMSGQMSGIYEVRIDGTPNRTHYRLFCVLDTKAMDASGGLRSPLLVILCGAAKAFRTEMPNKVYGTVRELRNEYLTRAQRSLA